MRISRVHLYGEPSAPRISMGLLSKFLRETFGLDASVRPPIGDLYGPDTLREIESCRVANPYRPHDPGGRARAADIPDGGMPIHDGYHLMEVLGGLVEQERGLLHVIFTDLVVGTYDRSDMRYHGRALVAANPCLISTTGMVEAPARPTDYCIEVMAARMAGADAGDVESRHTGRFLTYGDGRLQAAAEGYLLQAVFYLETGEAFCRDRDCRLFNAHWQSELIRSQVTSGRLCGYHRSILDGIRGG